MSHIHEKIDFTVGVFIVYKNTVLLRKHDKYKSWMGVGGHIELDEDPIQAAIREAKEEVGIDISFEGQESELGRFDGDDYGSMLTPRFLHKHRISPTHEHINFIYFAKAKSNIIAPGEGESTEGIEWFTKEQLDTLNEGIPPVMKYFAQKALEALSS